MNVKTPLLLLTAVSFSLNSAAQSISGNVRSAAAEGEAIGYATVNIYKGDKLVANVLSDGDGNFNVKLDTGTYQAEILYFGYKKVTKEIKVVADEKSEFSMEEDEVLMKEVMISAPSREAKDLSDGYYAPSHDAITIDVAGGSGAYSYSWSSGVGLAATTGLAAGAFSRMWGDGSEPTATADTIVPTYGRLTAGEINDFSKWNLWEDLTSGELKEFETAWGFAPSNRYSVQLKDQNGLPLANAKVELLNGADVLFTARSDNTGKAELWASLLAEQSLRNRDVSIRATYNGQTQTVTNAREFGSRINTITFNTECAQSENVDIAIVVDATGSMQDEIDYLKYDLNDVIFKSKEYSSTLNLRFANIFYRDLGDAYVTKTKQFASVLSESVAYINGNNADGGGDGPEAVEIALDSAINRLQWRDDTRAKIILLVLDAPPHNTPTIQEKMRKLSYQAAERGIRIVIVAGSGIDKGTEYLMRCVALATNGTYTFLTDHSGIGNPHIAPSTDHYQVEVLNELLTRVIKSFTYMPDCQQTLADLGVNLPDSVVTVTTYESDSTGTDSVIASIDTIEFQWRFYPNPTDGIVNIATSKEIKELYISDLSGKVLQVLRNIKPNEPATADLSDYASGIYLIRYPVGKQWVSGQVVLTL